MARQYTNKLIGLAEDGVLTWEQLARECLSYMSEADAEDVYSMLIDEEDEVEEDE